MHISLFFRNFVPFFEYFVFYMRMRLLLMIAALLLLLVGVGLLVLSHPAFGLWKHRSEARIHASQNYRDGMFQNQEPTPQFTDAENGRDSNPLGILWRFLTNTDTLRMPQQPIRSVKTDLSNLPADCDWLVWFGHSSYLFSLNGIRILVDPVLKAEWPSSWILNAFPGTEIYSPDDLPDIDVLIITHEHWDHMDYATLRDLRKRVKNIVCPLGIADYLSYWGYADDQITELDWYENHTAEGGLSITCLPSRHFSNRLLGKWNQTLWASFMVEYAGRKVYIGGDGGYDKRFSAIRKRFGSVDLAFLENGQYNANWRYIHTMPDDLEKVILDLQAQQVFTVHHDKYALAMHPWQEPDSVAHNIAAKHGVRLLDAPIGEIVRY